VNFARVRYVFSYHDVTINSPRMTPICVDAYNDGTVQSD